MPYFKSIRNRRGRRGIESKFELQLTSLLDIFIIVLVFLLKSYSVATNSFTAVPGLEMPLSKSQDTPPDSLNVIVTPQAISFDNEEIVIFIPVQVKRGGETTPYGFREGDLDEGNRRILPLYDALIKAREKSEILRAKSAARDDSGKPLPFEGVLAIQADKAIDFTTIRKIMYTAATAGYKIFRFLAIRKDG